MKIDAPSQILNVTNTTSQYHRHQLRQKYIMYAKQTTKHQARQLKHQVHQTKHQVRQTKHQLRQNIDIHCFLK